MNEKQIKEKRDNIALGQNAKNNLQWHPAFVAGIQIEFGEEANYLTFTPEYLLGTKPMQIDVLIKKDSDQILNKNIGRIFRKHNIIEYKSPGDYLSIDDFYKIYGYTCFYKSNTRFTDTIKFCDLTITFVSESYPRKLIRHLQKTHNYQSKEIESGIYYIIGSPLPIQIIVTSKLSKKENLWLGNLTNHLKNMEEVQDLLREYKKHKKDTLYESVMDIIVKANQKLFEKEGDAMCKALEELMKDELEAQMLKGKAIGAAQGENRVNELNQKLINLGRIDDILKSVTDKLYQQKLFKEFNL